MDNNKYIGNKLDDRYEILDVIGEGGMAVVYKALDHRLNRYVAVKIMRDDMAADEDFRRRFCAESHAVAMLSNPNIVAVYDVSHHDEMEYIVMELIDGITLKQYLERKGAIGWKEALHFSKQIAKALAHAHERGIIHRDIKPQNIMLLRDGTIKVADFGIAALENEASEENGQALGSIHYIAPEQARGEFPDARSDVYSLGIVMYEMLSGKQPYLGESISEIALKHLSSDVVALHEIVPDIPPELEKIVSKAMNVSLEERYQTANDLIKDIDEFTHAQTKSEQMQNPAVVPVRSVTELSKDDYRRRRRTAQRVSYTTGTFALMAVAVALFIFLWRFWLGDIFSASERINIPNFTGENYEAVINDINYSSLYSFNVVYEVNPNYPVGTVVSQSPNVGRSMMYSSGKIDIVLYVSTQSEMVIVPQVVNYDYRYAINTLKAAGLSVEIVNSISDSVTEDYVISISPFEGESVNSGSTVYVTVSSGPQIDYVTVPNMIGLTEDSAINKIESSGLSYGGATRTRSDYDLGTVIGQSIDAHSQTEEHSKIYLTISAGPEG